MEEILPGVATLSDRLIFDIRKRQEKWFATANDADTRDGGYEAHELTLAYEEIIRLAHQVESLTKMLFDAEEKVRQLSK